MEINAEQYGPDEFWGHAARYADMSPEDHPFAEEISYMMVTLYRTGA